MTTRPAATGRDFEMEIDLAADPATVWRALTDPVELTRWFPLQAEVTPGEGGTMSWMWDGAWTWVSRIDRWEVGRHLRLVQDAVRPFDVHGKPVDEAIAAPCTLVLDFILEARGGSTRLRLVHSGFGRGTVWDDELDGVAVGWQFELRGLHHYLTRHRGRDRVGRMATLTTPLSQEEAWDRLRSAAGFAPEPWPPVAGQPMTVRLGPETSIQGTVDLWVPARDLSLVVPSLGDGTLRIGTHRSGGRTGVICWLGTHGNAAGVVDTLRARADALIQSLFGGD